MDSERKEGALLALLSPLCPFFWKLRAALISSPGDEFRVKELSQESDAARGHVVFPLQRVAFVVVQAGEVMQGDHEAVIRQADAEFRHKCVLLVRQGTQAQWREAVAVMGKSMTAMTLLGPSATVSCRLSWLPCDSWEDIVPRVRSFMAPFQNRGQVCMARVRDKVQKWSQHLLQVWMERAGRQADLSSLWGASGTTPVVMDVLERLLLTEKEEEGEGEGEEEEEERDEQVQAGPQGDW